MHVQVFSKLISGEYHIFVAANTKGVTILHWGVSKLSPGEWLVSHMISDSQIFKIWVYTLMFIFCGYIYLLSCLFLLHMKVPPVEIWPENSKLVSGACQSYFIDKITEKGSFQVVYLRALFNRLIWVCLNFFRLDYILTMTFFSFDFLHP